MEFTLIKGGLEEKLKPKYKFMDASVTDTRLMGVLGLRLHYVRYLEIDNSYTDLYYCFYYDIEEIGLDTLNIYELADEDGVALATKACFGGLGAMMWPVSEKEALYLVQTFVKETKRRKQELPSNISEVAFMLREESVLSEQEIRSLNLKMCTMLRSNYAIVNYYLMRGFGKDEEAVKLLQNPNAPAENFDDISMPAHATFLKNTIEEFVNPDYSLSYLSESLIETKNKHYIYTSEIRITGSKVWEARSKGCFEISTEEASLLLSRPEYVTVYRICCPMEDFDVDFAGFTIGTTRTGHDTGDMYMEFKPNNNHVEKSEFKLYEDISALYFVSDYGELVIAAYSLDEIKMAEHKIKMSAVNNELQLMVKMELARSILFEFAESGFTSFAQFIKSLE